MHTLESTVKIKGDKPWLGDVKVVILVHSVVLKILGPIKVTDSPSNFVSVAPSTLVHCMLVKFL